MRSRIVTAAVLLVAISPACDRPPKNSSASQPSATSAPVTQPATESQPARVPAIIPESADWTLETCLERLRSDALGDVERGRRSAAVRMVRLSKFDALVVPDPLPDEWGETLFVASLAEDRWCLGVRREDERRLAMPVLIEADGKVSSPTAEAEEEATVLFVSQDADVFPHVLLTPTRVVLIEDSPRAALVAKSLGGARFDYRLREEKWPYIALVVPNRAVTSTNSSAPAGEPAATGEDAPTEKFVEVAMYRWDPDELAFLGPASDKLPDPPGGKFELDLRESKALIPVGGDIPEAPAAPAVPRPKKPQFERPPD